MFCDGVFTNHNGNSVPVTASQENSVLLTSTTNLQQYNNNTTANNNEMAHWCSCNGVSTRCVCCLSVRAGQPCISSLGDLEDAAMHCFQWMALFWVQQVRGVLPCVPKLVVDAEHSHSAANLCSLLLLLPPLSLLVLVFSLPLFPAWISLLVPLWALQILVTRSCSLIFCC